MEAFQGDTTINDVLGSLENTPSRPCKEMSSCGWVASLPGVFQRSMSLKKAIVDLMPNQQREFNHNTPCHLEFL